MKFSITTQSFYAEGLQFGASLPGDAVEIEQSTADELFQAINNGARVYSESGVLKTSEPRPDQYHTWDSYSLSWVITDENAETQKNDQREQAEAEKQERIKQANEYINSKQWPGKAVMGRISDAEKNQYNEWLDYLDALEAVDTSTAPNITWPEKPA